MCIRDSYKYDEICDKIKNKIKQRIYLPDTPLPPENTLAEEFKVSRITIRNALRNLIEEGYVYTTVSYTHLDVYKRQGQRPQR